jgi:CheY-like chemotaxis protein
MAGTAKQLIVYAEDDQDDIDLVKESFESYSRNIDLVCLSNGQAVLDYLTAPGVKASPCLIILDLNLPGIGGFEVLKRLRNTAKYRNTPIVLFTTSSLPRDKAFAHFYGAGFVTKPINYKQMDEIIHKFVEHCTDEVKNTIRKELYE